MRRTILIPVALAATVVAFLFACSSDPDTPLGSDLVDDGLIRSRPGDVVVDTIGIVSGDTSFAVNSVIAKTSTMTLGRKNGFETAMLIRFDFSNAGSDTLRVVSRATLSLRVTTSTQTDSFSARFFELTNAFSESDTLFSLSLDPSPLPDSLGGVDRSMQFFPSTYSLSKDIVQQWIRGEIPHHGIAVVLNDTTTTQELSYGARESSIASGLRPFLTVVFSDQASTNYPVMADGTFVTSRRATEGRVLSDGATRRVFFPFDVSTVGEGVLLHDARLVLHIVPDSHTGGDLAVTLYAPEGSDIGTSEILGGTDVVSAFIPTAGRFELPLRTILQRFIASPSSNHGLVLRYAIEGTAVREVAFYGSGAADSLQPRYRVTYSEAPEFRR